MPTVAMCANYDNIRRVGYQRWDHDEDDDANSEPDEPEVDQDNARIDELYYDKYSGDLAITLTTDDGYLSISVPIKAKEDWNELVHSLPVWGPREE